MLLYITANRKPVEESVSLTVGGAFLDAYRTAFPDSRVEKLDLFEETFPLPKREELAMWERQRVLSEEEVNALMNPHVEQFKRAKRIVFVTPMWNMSFPPQVKAYIDRIIVPGHTFEFTEKGIEGRMNEKQVLHIQSTGGIYSDGPLTSFEHGDSYLRLMMKLIGVPSYDLIRIEGTSTNPDHVPRRLRQAETDIQDLLTAWQKKHR
ncbi:FMN-dependent NADH-azoreductase [Salisediminibacterium beveridgei]|uniref:FMN dependent NADH:quinone oxidoreductase n=1 Tax=Salisediminibacterium beveridgei TaxID=632773 RepID=A0A1D7QR20_9BACI|nr:NAD(P)H-dependent oxidoreductase [Salisediminibacterium beveridgei]AOM81453.1 FMN-dependent NADH-azoreductase [Salisediminibacterium beveridgei]